MSGLFELGRTVMTKGVEALGIDCAALLDRHHAGDWGDVDRHDRAANEAALSPDDPDRILSAYMVGGRRVMVITEADRSATTVLLAEEY